MYSRKRESVLEQQVRQEVMSKGGRFIKLVGVRGIPDRMILLPKARVAFLELKREGQSPTKIQHHWLSVLTALGFKAGWADNLDDAKSFIGEM